MKLLSCYIENFGKLSKFNYEFSNGINTIKEENGFGKTTFASFIKAMFYGLDVKKNTKNLIDRKKYEPWQGGAFGGNIVFEIGKKKYKIERFFGKKENEDTFKLYDLDTNLESDDFSDNIGEEVFKINKEAFERSIFISGQNMETEMNDSINAKLGNILESENDINNSEEALKRIEEAIKVYKKTGGKGLINEKNSEKIKLEKKIEESEIDKKNLEERKQKNEEIKQEIMNLQKKQEEYRMIISKKMEEEARLAKLENYDILKNQVKEYETKIKKAEKFFNGNIPTDKEIETLIEKCLQIERYKIEVKNFTGSFSQTSEMKELNQIFGEENLSEDIINDKITKYDKTQEMKNNLATYHSQKNELEDTQEKLIKKTRKIRTIDIIILVFAIVLGIVAILMFMKANMNMTLFLGIAAAILGITFSIIAFSMRKDNITIGNSDSKIKELDKSIETLSNNIKHLNKEIDEFIDRYSKEKNNEDKIIELTEIKTNFIKYQDFRNNVDEILKKQKEIMEKLTELNESIENYLFEYFGKVEPPFSNYAQELKTKKGQLLELKEEYNKRIENQKLFERTINIEEIEKSKIPKNASKEYNLSKEKLEEDINEMNDEINKLNDQKNYNKNQMEIIESKLEAIFDIENDLEELNTSIVQMEENARILEDTKKYLNKAKTQFSSRYLGGMKKSFLQNIEKICGSKLAADLDVNLDVKIDEKGSNKEIRYFSTGYKDLIYICMRLSLIEALYKEEKPFIVLDDPFVNLDETKIQNAMKLLRNIEKNYQIIYFICHESRICL